MIIGLLAAGLCVRVLWPVLQQLSLPIWALGLASYLVVWVPLLGAALFATMVRGRRSLRDDFGLRFRWIDLLVGLGVGLGLRFIAGLLELVTGGTLLLAPTAFDWTWFLLVVIAPVLVAPWVEELFFRGLALRALARSMRGIPSRSAGAALAVAVSAALFAAVHLLEQPVDAWPRVAAINLIVGAALGLVALRTGRLGGPIIAHIVFNATGLAPLLAAIA